MSKVVNFFMLPLTHKMATRLNRMQHFKLQLIAILLVMIFGMILGLVENMMFGANHTKTSDIVCVVLGLLIAIPWIIIEISASIARLHDCNCSGWWILIIYLLSRFLIFPIFLLYIWPGSKEANKYGCPSQKTWI